MKTKINALNIPSTTISKEIAAHLKDPSIIVQFLASLSVAQMGAVAEENDVLLTALMDFTKGEATFARAGHVAADQELAGANARYESLKLSAKMLESTQFGTESK